MKKRLRNTVVEILLEYDLLTFLLLVFLSLIVIHTIGKVVMTDNSQEYNRPLKEGGS